MRYILEIQGDNPKITLSELEELRRHLPVVIDAISCLFGRDTALEFVAQELLVGLDDAGLITDKATKVRLRTKEENDAVCRRDHRG